MWLFFLAFLALCVLSLRGVRWAFVAFVVSGLLYFPARAGFQFDPHPCQLNFDSALAVHSLSNYAHIVLFALFFLMTRAQFRSPDRAALAWSALATILMGALVEVAQGLTGEGNCRARDLIPDTLGILLGSIIAMLLKRIGWRPTPTWSVRWRRDTQQRPAPERE
ncbi:MAG TPA: VanZ family protein [Pyrinomonadaceae bacterium]|nr:VanZ family protein [Pyrinomonadaceae bacterium]